VNETPFRSIPGRAAGAKSTCLRRTLHGTVRSGGKTIASVDTCVRGTR
jgi:hypothetical protein